MADYLGEDRVVHRTHDAIEDHRQVGDQRQAAAFQYLPDATVVLDRYATIIATNRAWRMFSLDNGGDPRRTGVGANYLDVCARSMTDGCHDAAFFAAQLRAVLAGEIRESQTDYLCPAPGRRRSFLARTQFLPGPAPSAIISHINTTGNRISDGADQSMRAMVDPLTGLATHALLESRLTAALARGCVGNHDRINSRDLGLIRVAIGGMSSLTNTFGSVAAREVPQSIAYRLQDYQRPGDTIAQLDGRTVMILTLDIEDDNLAALALQLRSAERSPHVIHGRRLHVPLTIDTYRVAATESAHDALNRAHRGRTARSIIRTPTGS